MIPPTWIALAVLTVVAGGAVGYATLEKSWRQNAELQVEQEKELNRRNLETISNLRQSKEIAEKTAEELAKELAELRAKEEADDAAITDLENSDEGVKKFLSIPTPDKLRCLWGEKQRCGVGVPTP